MTATQRVHDRTNSARVWRRLRRLRAGVAAELAGLREHSVGYFANPGNAGDALIKAGTHDAFRRARLTWRPVFPGDDVRAQIVIVGGGGNLVDLYDHVATALDAFVRSGAERIVVLPHGIRGQLEALALLRPHDVVFCRDLRGADHVAAHCAAQVVTGHDMAFHLRPNRLLRSRSVRRRAEPFLESRLGGAGWDLKSIAERQQMRFMRLDAERATTSPEGDLDISLQLMHGGVDDLSPISAWSFLRCVDSAQRVVTDRLHVAIAGALLGKPVQLWPNSYDKNRSVYEMSLEGWPNVEFVDTRPLSHDERGSL